MNNKILNILFLLFAFCSVLVSAEDGSVFIHLPREIEIDTGELYLGDIAVLSKENQTIEQVRLGHLSVPGQKVKIGRNTILSRLASNGIYKDEVSISGAEYVSVKLKAAKISKEVITAKAEKFLEESFKENPRICWELVTNIDDFFVEVNLKDIDIEAGYSKYGNSSRSRIVNVSVLKEDKLLEKIKLQFLLKYKARQLVAKKLISRGEEILKENIKVEEIITNNPASISCDEPYGKIAKRDIQPGQVIRNGSFAPKRPVKLVKRNQSVIVRLRTPGLLLTVPGQAMEDGYVDDLVKVKVKVTDQEKIIIAKVLENGHLEPLI